MLVLNQQEVRQALPMRETIDAMKLAFIALSQGQAEVPLRLSVPVRPEDATALFMPAYVNLSGSSALAVKVVTLFPKNQERKLPFIHAGVLVINPITGQIEALLEGGALTAIRTGAASGSATEVLARPDCRTAAVFGAGIQARTQLLAVCTVRQIETAYIYDLNPDRVKAFIADLAGQGPIPEDLRLAPSPDEAAALADIICAATTTRTPLFSPAAVRPGTHINGVGSYTPAMIEIPPDLLAFASVFVDSRTAVLAEAGEIIAAVGRGLIQPEDLVEIGTRLAESEPARTKAINFFKSVGVAVQDTAAAQLALKNARAMGLGTEVAW